MISSGPRWALGARAASFLCFRIGPARDRLQTVHGDSQIGLHCSPWGAAFSAPAPGSNDNEWMRQDQGAGQVRTRPEGKQARVAPVYCASPPPVQRHKCWQVWPCRAARRWSATKQQSEPSSAHALVVVCRLTVRISNECGPLGERTFGSLPGFHLLVQLSDRRPVLSVLLDSNESSFGTDSHVRLATRSFTREHTRRTKCKIGQGLRV